MSDEGQVPRYRRPTREMASAASNSEHGWRCWEMPDGAGFRLRTRVDDVEKSMTQQINGVAQETRKDISSIKQRIALRHSSTGDHLCDWQRLQLTVREVSVGQIRVPGR